VRKVTKSEDQPRVVKVGVDEAGGRSGDEREGKTQVSTEDVEVGVERCTSWEGHTKSRGPGEWDRGVFNQ
jgi:hypothetical protein